MNTRTDDTEEVTPQEAELADSARRMLMAYLDHSAASKIMLAEQGGEAIELPPRVIKLLAKVLGHMAKGESFSLINKSQLFSTQEAANFLNVSRPFVSNLVDSGKLKAMKVGRHRRIEFSELRRMKQQMSTETENAINEFSSEFGGED